LNYNAVLLSPQLVKPAHNSSGNSSFLLRCRKDES